MLPLHFGCWVLCFMGIFPTLIFMTCLFPAETTNNTPAIRFTHLLHFVTFLDDLRDNLYLIIYQESILEVLKTNSGYEIK